MRWRQNKPPRPRVRDNDTDTGAPAGAAQHSSKAVLHGLAYRLVTPVLVLIFLVLSCVVLRHYWVERYGSQPWHWFPITQVKLNGQLQHVNPDLVQQQLQGMAPLYFFSANLPRIRQQLRQAQPWLRTVKVRRVWPATLVLDLQEYHPLAVWNHVAYIDTAGDVVTGLQQRGKLPSGLPQLSGPVGSEAQVWSFYLLAKKTLSNIPVPLIKVALSDDQQWTLVLQNNLQINLGAMAVQVRLKRFARLYTLLLRQRSKLPLQVDLRYPHALAVQWTP